MEATLDLVSTCTTFLLVLKDIILNFVVVLAGKFHLLKSVKTLLETFWLCVLLEVIYLMYSKLLDRHLNELEQSLLGDV